MNMVQKPVARTREAMPGVAENEGFEGVGLWQVVDVLLGLWGVHGEYLLVSWLLSLGQVPSGAESI